jgi:hypothetical protein
MMDQGCLARERAGGVEHGGAKMRNVKIVVGWGLRLAMKIDQDGLEFAGEAWRSSRHMRLQMTIEP